MPVLREEKDVIVSRDTKDVNFQVGTASPRMEKIDPAYAGSGIGDALKNFWGHFKVGLDKNRAEARAQGALDAQTYDTPLDKKKDENGKEYTDAGRAKAKQSWLVADEYEKGFVSAAVGNEINKFQHESATRAQQAGLSGLSDEQWYEQEKQATANNLQKIGEWTSSMPAEAKVATAQALATSAEANYKLFNKARSGQAIVVEKRTLVAAGVSAQAETANLLNAGAPYSEAIKPIQAYYNRIQTSGVLDQKTKDDLVSSTAITLAQRSTDPEFIESVTNDAYKVLGNTTAMSTLNKTLYNEHKDKAQRYEGQVYMQLRSQINDVQQLPMEQRAGAIASLKSQMAGLYAQRRLSLGNLVSLTDGLYKPAARQANAAQNFQTALQGNQGVSLSGLQQQYPELSPSKLQKMVRDYADLSADNAKQVYDAGHKSGDSRMVELGLSKLAEHIDRGVKTLSFTVDTDGNIPVDTKNSLQGMINVIQSIDAGDSMSGGDLGKKQLIGFLPSDTRDLIAPIILNPDGNATNNLLNAVKMNNITKERNKNIAAIPSDKFLQGVADSQYGIFTGNGWTRWGTNKEEHQRQLKIAGLEAYTYLRKTGQLTADSGVNKELVTNFINMNSATLDIKQSKGSTIPMIVMGRSDTGNPILAQAQNAGLNPEFVEGALKDSVNSIIKTQVGDNGTVQRVLISPAAVGDHSSDFNVDIMYTDKNGAAKRAQNISLPLSFVQSNARKTYENRAADTEAEARRTAASMPLTVHDKSPSNGRTGSRLVYANVQGESLVGGLTPADSNELVSNILGNKEFYSSPHNGKIGFGQAAGDTKTVSVQQAVDNYKQELKTQVIPKVKELVKGNRVTPYPEVVSLLTELYTVDPKYAADMAGKLANRDVRFAPTHAFTNHVGFNKLSPEQKDRLTSEMALAVGRVNGLSGSKKGKAVNFDDEE